MLRLRVVISLSHARSCLLQYLHVRPHSDWTRSAGRMSPNGHFRRARLMDGWMDGFGRSSTENAGCRCALHNNPTYVRLCAGDRDNREIDQRMPQYCTLLEGGDAIIDIWFKRDPRILDAGWRVAVETRLQYITPDLVFISCEWRIAMQTR